MFSRRSKYIIGISLCGMMVVLFLPFVIMQVSDSIFFSSPHIREADVHGIETSAEDVPYVRHIINTYMTYADSMQETVIINSDGDNTLYRNESIDIAYDKLLELEKKGVINPLWVKEELQNFMQSNHLSYREYYSRDELEGGPEGIELSTIVWWKSGDEFLRLMYDQKYKRLLRIVYKGRGQIFASNDSEELCNSFAAYQGLDILEDWSFNGKRLVSQKASLSIEFSQSAGGAVLQIIPTELIFLEY